MLKLVLFDTDVMVDFLRGNPKAVALVNSHAGAVSLSPIVVAELYAGVKGDRELSILDELVAVFRIFPVTPEIARTGGLFRRDYGKSHGVGLADAIIAATATIESLKLMTLNVKHYPMLDDLKPPYRKG
jgi:hypothetical protein